MLENFKNKHECYGGTSCNWWAQNNPQNLDEKLEDLEIKGQVESIQIIASLR